jgi:hypothetical protein
MEFQKVMVVACLIYSRMYIARRIKPRKLQSGLSIIQRELGLGTSGIQVHCFSLHHFTIKEP